ncbi:hypothetical protein TVAG_391280 [Trichomonas vaginalis G3]|uniref:NTF2 domain-containing protein n=1 Tax=Trichomonas vaginalis (strain ATCC PRA-98 / G3) TaxID=412133 RepID=A2DFP1_TRIV3|nr:RNA-binding domain, RBD family-containing protein [Trichomonas vaginalis G3]EAY20744.1 hypothetical protein TVAG_391280 [Trichomonas vaginalis G3]KAI5529481.1 RNA-binding domain, RBD family-containing protein [Trichomonas vaginalis G3]|eukprot:XP_001581730.1 hypothetical protein [Trichomonas vaginalis G3]
MENEEELGAKFVATYYRLIYRCPSAIPKLYDTHAILRRDPPKTNFQICLLQHELIPFKPNESIVKIFRYVTYSAGESLVVSVYGSIFNNLGPKMFFQQFMLKKNGLVWLIHSDIFYIFTSQTNEVLYGIFEQPQPPAFTPIQQPAQSQQIVPQFKRISQSAKRYDNFDPEKTITIINLPNTYNGNDVVAAFRCYGNVTSKYFTHNTVYIEFENEEEADAACNSRLPLNMPNNSHIKVEKGIAQKESRGSFPVRK